MPTVVFGSSLYQRLPLLNLCCSTWTFRRPQDQIAVRQGCSLHYTQMPANNAIQQAFNPASALIW